MSERRFYPNDGSSSKRSSSLLRQKGNASGSSASHGSSSQNSIDKPTERLGNGGQSTPNMPRMAPNDQTVISSTPPLNVSATQMEGPFQIGDRLGVYELTEYIGGGGMGSVYKAVDTLLDRVVAIKILLPEAAGNEEATLRFQNEARSAARLDHECIAKVYYVGEEEGLPYLVFEYVDGANVRDLVRQHGPFSLTDAIGVALQVADSLSHASENGVVHRDVKPSNILLRDNGQVKLIDFGLARIVEAEERDNDLTASGVTLGTFDYISPEQARDPRTVDIRSDIYSLGCTLFYMLAGRPPFPEGTVLQKLLQHQGDRPPNVREFRPELPEEIALLLERMLAKDPNDRFQTPSELRDQTQLLAAQLGLNSLHFGVKSWPVPTAQKPSVLSRHLPWLLPVTALLGIVLGLDYYLTQKPVETSVPFPELSEPAPMNPTTTSAITPFTPQASGTSSQATGGLSFPATDDPMLTNALSVEEPLYPREELNVPNSIAGSLSTEGVINGVENPNGRLPDITIKPSSIWSETHSDSENADFGMPTPYGLSGTNGTPRPLTASAALEKAEADQNENESNQGDENPTLADHAIDDSSAASPRSSKNTLGTNARYGIITVGESHEESVSFANLALACRAAATGDIIELRYNGARVEQPLALSGKNLIIRAAKGYDPMVIFRPTKSEAADPDPILTPNSMVSLNGGSLTAIEVSFRLELNETAPVDQWTLFEVQSGEAVQLEKCQLSVQNRSQQTATFFRVTSSPSDELADGEGNSLVSVAPVSPAKIVLTDSMVRGNATFLLAEDERPVNCSWKNGLLVTDGLMLDVRGSEKAWNHTDRITVSFKHLTAFAASGMCRLGDRRQGSPTIPVDYVCYDSVILVASTNAMITQWIGETPSDTDSLFHFVGDRNYYQGFDYFLIQKSLNSKADLNQLDFSAWQNRWTPDHETYSLWGWFAFVDTPDASKPLDQRGPADYALSPDPENHIRYAADDGSSLGFIPEHLPSAAASTSP